MKIDELFEDLPGSAKKGFLASLFGGPSKQIKASIDQGVKAWMQYAQNLSQQNRVANFDNDPITYAKVFRQWAAIASNLPVNHPALNNIETELARTLKGRSTKPIQNAVTKLVNLTQSMVTNPESRYTPEMKAQAVFNLLDKKYGKYIKDIATKQALEKFVNDTSKANPNMNINDLKAAAEAEASKITTKSPTAPATPTSSKTKKSTSKRLVPGKSKVRYANKTYTWINNAWRSGTEVLTGSDKQAATAKFRNRS